MSTDFRALCAELADKLERLHKQSVTAPHTQFVELSNGRHVIPIGNDIFVQDLMVNWLLDRARAALAVEAVGPSDEELYDLASEYEGEPVQSMRAALARYGSAPCPVPTPENTDA